ncbi:MAG: hypothetical protein ABWY46_17705 [Pseudomonas sp.]
MNDLKITASNSVRDCVCTFTKIPALDQTDYTDVAGAVFSLDGPLPDNKRRISGSMR